MPTATVTLPFSPFTNRILEDTKFTNMEVIEQTPISVIISRIVKMGHYDASKARCCGQEIEDYFKKRKETIEENTKNIRSNQYSNPSASEVVADRKKLIDELLGSNTYVVLNPEELRKLQLKMSGTSKPLSDWAIRDNIKAMGYYYTTSIGLGLKGAYISKAKETKDIVARRAAKVIKAADGILGKGTFEVVKAKRDEWINRLKTKDYVILDAIQLNDIMERLSSKSTPIPMVTFRKLMADYDCGFNIIETDKYYYASAKQKYTKGNPILKDLLEKELEEHPRVYGAFPDSIAKLLIHADIIYIRDFVDVDDEFLKELFKEVNYSEGIIKLCLNAIHNYRKGISNESLTDEEVNEVHENLMNEINSTKSDKKIVDEPKVPVKFGEIETSEGVEVSREQAEQLKNTLEEAAKQPEEESTEVTTTPEVDREAHKPLDESKELKEDFLDFLKKSGISSEEYNQLHGNDLFSRLARAITMPKVNNFTEDDLAKQNHTPEKIRPMAPNQPHDITMGRYNIPTMINPTISGTCPYCNNLFTVPATTTHRVYCFACGNIMQY